MAARLRLQQQRKGRIAADIDPLDRVHLYRDIQGHEFLRTRAVKLNGGLTSSSQFPAVVTVG